MCHTSRKTHQGIQYLKLEVAMCLAFFAWHSARSRYPSGSSRNGRASYLYAHIAMRIFSLEIHEWTILVQVAKRQGRMKSMVSIPSQGGITMTTTGCTREACGLAYTRQCIQGAVLTTSQLRQRSRSSKRQQRQQIHDPGPHVRSVFAFIGFSARRCSFLAAQSANVYSLPFGNFQVETSPATHRAKRHVMLSRLFVVANYSELSVGISVRHTPAGLDLHYSLRGPFQKPGTAKGNTPFAVH